MAKYGRRFRKGDRVQFVADRRYHGHVRSYTKHGQIVVIVQETHYAGSVRAVWTVNAPSVFAG